jgi:hypothetical protein
MLDHPLAGAQMPPGIGVGGDARGHGEQSQKGEGGDEAREGEFHGRL